jgi:nitroimidazol reductase NimA-like FMN-containing flavoprotein (pyridoxamine 5'-phosphate oxidase superfamily)
MADEDGQPYVVPFNFGYKDNILYLHSAQHGKKMDILKKNNKVCVAFSTDHQLGWQHEGVACSYLMRYRSVQLFGTVEFIESIEEKAEALDIVMKHYTDREFKYGVPSLNEVACYKVKVTEAFGKEFGY